LIKKPMKTDYTGFVIDSSRKWALAEFEAMKHGPLPYSTHLTAVAGIVACYTRDEDVIAAAWLHDIVEDFRDQFTVADVRHMTNDRVATLVDLLTDPVGPRKLVKPISLARIAKDADACLIKCADRFHNQSTAIIDSHGVGRRFVKMYVDEFEDFSTALFPSIPYREYHPLIAGLEDQYAVMKMIMVD